jgi:hypothetical protein
MKFEANIPSYLKTGQGVFPVQQKTMAVANDSNMVALAPMGQDRIESRPQPENLLDKMQQNINRGIDEREFMPKSDVESDFKRVMPQIKPGVMREPTERMVQADGEDIFIG